jgi:hypothetical protein
LPINPSVRICDGGARRIRHERARQGLDQCDGAPADPMKIWYPRKFCEYESTLYVVLYSKNDPMDDNPTQEGWLRVPGQTEG